MICISSRACGSFSNIRISGEKYIYVVSLRIEMGDITNFNILVSYLWLKASFSENPMIYWGGSNFCSMFLHLKEFEFVRFSCLSTNFKNFRYYFYKIRNENSRDDSNLVVNKELNNSGIWYSKVVERHDDISISNCKVVEVWKLGNPTQILFQAALISELLFFNEAFQMHHDHNASFTFSNLGMQF